MSGSGGSSGSGCDGGPGAHCSCSHDSPLVSAWRKRKLLLVKRLERYRQHQPAAAAALPPSAAPGKVGRLPPLATDPAAAAACGVGDGAASGSVAPADVTFWNPIRAALPKVGSLQNAGHVPGGGRVTIYSEWPSWTASSKVGSLVNARHVPGGGERRHGRTVVANRRRSGGATYERTVELSGGGSVTMQTASLAAVKAKVGSLDNWDHRPGGGHVVVFDKAPHWTSQAKVDSLSNIGHVPTANFIISAQYLSPLRKRLRLMKERLVWTRGQRLSPIPADVTL